MTRNEVNTCADLIEPALTAAGWEFDRQVAIGPGRVNLTGERMYDESQSIIADYILRLRSMPLAVFEKDIEGSSDVLEKIAHKAGKIQRCKLGDFVLTLGAESAAAGCRIVVEAKDNKSYDLKTALEEIAQARDNRECAGERICAFEVGRSCGRENAEPIWRGHRRGLRP